MVVEQREYVRVKIVSNISEWCSNERVRIYLLRVGYKIGNIGMIKLSKIEYVAGWCVGVREIKEIFPPCVSSYTIESEEERYTR